MHRCLDSGAPTSITQLRIDRGLSFDNARAKLDTQRENAAAARRELHAESGFW